MQPRCASARLRTGGSPVATTPVGGEFAPTNPPRKRQRTKSDQQQDPQAAWRRVRGKRGKLRLITEIPLEILYEIFSHLSPADVLHLSQATKTLRELLLTRSAMAIWKCAFYNATPAPPECPPDLNLIQYANLLYGRHCYFCTSSPASVACWAYRIRCCNSCLRKKFCSRGGVLAKHRRAQHICPGVSVRTGGVRTVFWLTSELTRVSQELTELEGNETALHKYVTDGRSYSSEKTQHAQLCDFWSRDAKMARVRELDQARGRRKDSIIQKLKDLGWGSELDRLSPQEILRLPGLRQPKELTDRTWENIRPDLVRHLQEMRDAMEDQDRLFLLEDRISFLRCVINTYAFTRLGSEILPTYADFAVMEPFQSLIFETPSERKLDNRSFEVHADLLPSLSEEWRNSSIKLLEKLIPNFWKTELAGGGGVLGLATTFFRCKWCTDSITYPRVLVHKCLQDNHSDGGGVLGTNGHQPWNCNHNQVSFDGDASNAAKGIISICGEDPETVSAITMDELDRRVECLRCVHPSQGRLVMRWKMAIQHEVTHHLWEDARWQVVSDHDVLKAREQEDRTERRQSPLACRWCRLVLQGEHDMINHLGYIHGIDPPYIERNTFQPLDVSIAQQPPFAIRIPTW